MSGNGKIVFLILGVSGLVFAQRGDDQSGGRQHRPGRKGSLGSRIVSNGKSSQTFGSTSTSDNSGSMDFKPLLGGTPPAGGSGGNSGGNNSNVGPSGGNGPGGNGPGWTGTGGNGPSGSGPSGNGPGGSGPSGTPGGNGPSGSGPGGSRPGNTPDSSPNWGGPVGGGSNNPGTHTVPEIDPASGMSALTLLSGALLVVRGRRKKIT
jgi:hypothetical protein